MIEIQTRRAYWALGMPGDYRNFEIDLGNGKGVWISWCNGKAIVDYRNKSLRHRTFNDLNDAVKFSTDWFSRTFPHLV